MRVVGCVRPVHFKMFVMSLKCVLFMSIKKREVNYYVNTITSVFSFLYVHIWKWLAGEVPALDVVSKVRPRSTP